MRLLMGTAAWRKLRSYCSFWLVLSVLLIDSFVFFEYGIWQAKQVQAAVGDFSVFAETAGTEVVAGTGNNVTWDNSVSESGSIDLQANTSDIELVDGGKYLVLYSAWTEQGATGGGSRRSVASYLTLNGSPVEYGWGGGYIRDSENDLTAYNSGAAILDTTAGDNLAVVLDRDDTNPGGGTAIRGTTNGVSVLKLDNDLDYLRVYSSAGTTDISGNTAFTAVNWDTEDEVDTGSFTFSAPATGVTVSGAIDRKFLVTTNVKLNVTGAGGPRQNYEVRLTLDGVEIPGTRTTGFMRFDNGDINTTMQYTGIIQKTSASDQTFAVEVRREGVESAATDIVGNATALALVALPADTEVLSLSSSANETLTSAESTMSFGNQISTAPSSLSHSTTTSSDNIDIDVGGDYLVFATTYTSRTSGTGRDVPRIDWLIDATTQAYGGHGHYNRGDQGVDDTFTSGGSSGAIFPGLTGGQVLELAQSDETTGTPISQFQAERVAVQVILLSELNAAVTTNVSLAGTQSVTTNVPASDVYAGDQIVVIESVSARNITNIVLTESGSVDATADITNTRLFYDIDVSDPYDCASESYAGTESEFGSTGTFSGADGTLTFNDSASISPTAAFCGYVVYDVAAGAVDGQTVNFSINNPSTDIIVTGAGVVVPGNVLGGETVTTVQNSEITQTGYHWRNDDGSETAATSATGGVENTPGLSFSSTTPQRLRLGIAGAGTGSETNQYRLEYAQKVTTCEVIGSWTDVGSGGGAWNMFDSVNVFEGADTTNIAVVSGGVTDGANEFVTPNGGVRDASSQTGNITIDNTAQGTIAEFGNTTVTNGSLTTINLTETFYDPIVVASVRYDRTATQRTPRIDNKASSSFDILIDNFDGSLTGTTNIDYIVFEKGDWLVDDGGSGTRVYAGSTDTAVVSGRTIPTDPGGPTITFPTSFPGEPAVITSVVTRNDTPWLYSSVYQGAGITNPPGASDMRVFLNDNFDSNGHGGSETIDYIVFEQGHGTSNSFVFDAVTTGAATVSNTPISVSYDTAYGGIPAVILTQSLTTNGSDGAYSQIDTNIAPTASAVTVSTDEEGLGADRIHAAEEVAVISFETGGTFVGARADLSQFVELEYSIQATASAVEGVSYCFRVSDAGTTLRNYDNYPEATLNADVTVASLGTQVATIARGSSDVHIGGAFSIVDNAGIRNVTEITIAESGTIDAAADIDAVRLFYEFDTSAPFDCASESYAGTELQYGSDSLFSAANGTSTFSGSALISNGVSAMCIYPVLDLAGTTSDALSIEISIGNPSSDVVIDSGSVGPGSEVTLVGTTLTTAPALTLANYHWRNDDGDETGATSATDGNENTLVDGVFQGTIKRLRLAVNNDGTLTESDAELRLEYGTKVTTCANVGVWQRVDSGVAFESGTTSSLSDGSDTTNIAVASGGVSNPATTFVTPNAGQEETTDQIAAVGISNTEYVEVEYALQITETAGFGATYCFRVTDAGEPLTTYTNYPELTVQDRQDFFVQRGTETVTGAGVTLTAGTDYIAPANVSAAYVRITNTSMTGAGSDTLGQARNPDDVFAYITAATNLTSGFTITRPPTATDNTRVSWEIVEYVGVPGGDNEFIVREQDIVTYGAASLFATGTTAIGVVDDADIAVIITGQFNPATAVADYNTGMSLSNWSASTDEPVFERGDADGIAAGVSYAVVEFTGANWNIQRVEHTYTVAGATESEPMTAVNSLARTFLHTQKISGDELFNLDENGHEVWLSSIGAVSFVLQSGATNPSLHRSVAWVMENTQLGAGAIQVYRINGTISSGGVQPITVLNPIGATINTTNASIWTNMRSSGAGAAHPRAIMGARILNDTQFELWKSDEGQNQTWRTEIVEWPVAETSIRQTHYRLYVDNDTLTPTDPWPAGVSDLGENTAMTDLDEPLGEGERVRIRTGLFVNNASLITDTAAFKLQYGRRISTCSAIASWSDLDDPGGGDIWRGYDAAPADGATLPGGLLSVTDEFGTYEEASPSASNPSTVGIGDYIEYDWNIEHNGALQKSSYCFRMVYSDGEVIDGYDVYPTIRTTGYTPVIVNWRWYDDETSLTPVTDLATEQSAPIEIAASNTLKLRIAVTEIEGAPGNNIKFNLQYSQWADFRDGGTTLTASSSCGGLTRTWCYAEGAGVDSAIVDTTVLTGVDSCTSGTGVGCGTVNEAEGLSSLYDQPVFTTSEHEFTLLHNSVGFDQVYYFRMLDATNGVPLVASTSYPSLTTAGAALTFTISGLDTDQVFEGVTLDATTTATSIDFGRLPFGTSREAAQRLTVFTNGTEGYRVYLQADQQLTNAYGDELSAVTGTNITPQTWEAGCAGSATGCFGYHAGDNTLYDGSLRFALDDSYAALDTTPVEIMASGVPVTFDVSEIIYRTEISETQPAGEYTTTLRYIVVPVF